ncbi:MAG TPA: CPBP family intramembrane glutamic endopeptidase [Anaerolineales bacterium]|nr:CPBP family intramembrane glutamic endopeptidase [Anaerolineales bacterium]
MKNFAERQPFWFSLAFTVLIMQGLGAVTVVAGRALGVAEQPVRVLAAAATTVVPLLIVRSMGWWKDAGFVDTTRNVYALIVPLIVMLTPLVYRGTVQIGAQAAFVGLLAVLFTGISEEVVYRGLFIRAFLPRGRWQAVLVPAVLFGAAHIVQSLGGGWTLQDNVVQMLNAFVIGVLYGAVRLRINNLWPLIIIHALYDLFWGASGLSTGAYTLSDVPLGLFVLTWIPSLIAAYLIMRKPLTATIDGNPAN